MKRLLFLAAILGLSCSGPEDSSESTASGDDGGKLSVYVVNYPLQYFAERIGGDLVEVHFPEIQGDPAFWKPDAEAISSFQKADRILLNGASYAKWVKTVSLPTSKLVHTSASFRDRYLEMEGTVVHSHGPDGDHSHGETAFTTWLDPTLAVEHANTIRDAFVEARPADEATFKEGFVSLERDLLELDERMEQAVAGKAADRPLMGSHPVYQYLARRYGLDLRAVHFEPDASPADEAWHDLQRVLEEHPAKWMLWEGAPIDETAEKLKAMGLESVVFDPSGNRPAAGDYLSVMASNVSGLESVFSAP